MRRDPAFLLCKSGTCRLQALIAVMMTATLLAPPVHAESGFVNVGDFDTPVPDGSGTALLRRETRWRGTALGHPQHKGPGGAGCGEDRDRADLRGGLL